MKNTCTSRVAGLAVSGLLAALVSGCAASPAGGDPTKPAAPIRGQALLSVARQTAASGDDAAAVSLYREAHKRNPHDPAPLVGMGGALFRLGAFEQAAAAYREAVHLKGAEAEARRGLGNALIALDRPQLAIEQLTASLALAKDPRTYNGLGVAYDMQSQHTHAQAMYRAGLAVRPGDLALENNLGLSLAASGDTREAIAVLSRAVGAPDAGPRERNNLALAYGLAGDMANAARIARRDMDEAAVKKNLAMYAALRARNLGPLPVSGKTPAPDATAPDPTAGAKPVALKPVAMAAPEPKITPPEPKVGAKPAAPKTVAMTTPAPDATAPAPTADATPAEPKSVAMATPAPDPTAPAPKVNAKPAASKPVAMATPATEVQPSPPVPAQAPSAPMLAKTVDMPADALAELASMYDYPAVVQPASTNMPDEESGAAPASCVPEGAIPSACPAPAGTGDADIRSKPPAANPDLAKRAEAPSQPPMEAKDGMSAPASAPEPAPVAAMAPEPAPASPLAPAASEPDATRAAAAAAVQAPPAPPAARPHIMPLGEGVSFRPGALPEPATFAALPLHGTYYRARLAAYPSRIDATQGWLDMVKRAPELYGAVQIVAERSTLNAASLSYALVTPPISARAPVEKMCAEFEVRGIACRVESASAAPALAPRS